MHKITETRSYYHCHQLYGDVSHGVLLTRQLKYLVIKILPFSCHPFSGPDAHFPAVYSHLGNKQWS